MDTHSRRCTNVAVSRQRIMARYLPVVLTLFFAGTALSLEARVAVVTLNLRSFGPATSVSDTWELFAPTSHGDNDGIAGYDIPAPGATDLNHTVIGQEIGGVLLNGFSLDDDVGDVIFGGTNSAAPASIIHGVGSADFVVPMPPAGFTNVGMPEVGDAFAPLLLANGTGDWLTVRQSV